MAEPTFTQTVGSRRTLNWAGIHGGGEKVLTDYGYQNYTYTVDKNGTQVHFIVGTGVPSTTYDLAPVGSEYVNLTTGRHYYHLYNDAGALKWAIVAVVVPLGTEANCDAYTLQERGLINIDTSDSSIDFRAADSADTDVTIS